MERVVYMLTVDYIWKGLPFLKKWFILYACGWFSQYITKVHVWFVDAVFFWGTRKPCVQK